jgi:hypothetical protein
MTGAALQVRVNRPQPATDPMSHTPAYSGRYSFIGGARHLHKSYGRLHHFTTADQAFMGSCFQGFLREKSHQLGAHPLHTRETNHGSEEGFDLAMHTPIPAPRSYHVLHYFDHLHQLTPCLKRSATLPYPAQLLLQHLLIKRVIRQAARGIEHTQHVVSPTPQDIDMHIARLRALLRRREKRERRLLHLALTVRSHPGKLVPGSVIVQFMLKHAGGFMFDGIDGRRLGMRLTKRRDAGVSIRTLIAHNLARHARFRHGVLQLRKDNGPVGLRDRRYGQRFDILLAQTMVSIR